MTKTKTKLRTWRCFKQDNVLFNAIIIVLFSWSFYSYDIFVNITQYNTIPPGAADDVVDADDDDRDGATEVQTNFYHSQYYTMITTKSKIKKK